MEGEAYRFLEFIVYLPAFKPLHGLPSAPGSADGACPGAYPEERRFPDMRKYELICIVHPDLDETAFNGVIEKVKGWIVEAGGSVDKIDIWGRKKLAYLIRKQREGQYVLINISLPPTATAALDQNLRYIEQVIRYMITVVE
jgi:small subunit ribosomal protein S6